jgi:uncharacterized protein (DUF305 family)
MIRSVVLRRAVLAGVTTTAAVLLSACGGGDHSSSGAGMDHGSATTQSTGVSAGAVFNDADVTFAQMMIPHHRQAVQMASMADGRASDAEVKTLAGKIKQAQQPEIDAMNGWLTAWGKPAPMPSASGGMDMGHAMPGLMSDADMTKLTASTGAAFDKQFLTMMIGHHEGAITMAQEESAKGSNRDAKALAQKIVADQQAEITTMKGILARL